MVLAAQQGAQPPARAGASEAAAQAAAAERGRALFKQNCAACHADDATGGRGPDLIRSSLVRHDKGGDLIGPVVTGGRADKGMPPFPLADSQVADLVAFVQAQITLFDLHTRFGPYPNDIPAERLATGTVEAGKAYFEGPGGCTKCHSVTGDLAGIAKKYNPPDLEVRFLYPSGSPTTAVVTLPSGKKFEGTLLLNDGFYVAINGKDGWYHSWPRSAVKVEVTDPLAAHAELLQKYTDADMHNLFTYLVTLK
ncbi:MAG: cytochrome c [Acidobacteriia bacterium]|nr:cytochrome c [Terriglobia bacterium]